MGEIYTLLLQSHPLHPHQDNTLHLKSPPHPQEECPQTEEAGKKELTIF